MRVTEPARDNQQPESGSAKEGPGLLEFFGKVLDQLSLSAWLPAVMLVGVVSLLTQVHGQQTLDVGAALRKLAEQPLGILLVIAFALILTTMITQAFAFESIRILEGYWGPSWLASAIGSRRIRTHARRKRALDATIRSAEKAAFLHARERMLDDGVERILIDILEARFRPSANQSLSAYPEAKVREARSMGWRSSAPPASLRRVEAAERRWKLYPDDHRLLPTVLGNTLRSFEDDIKRADKGDLQGFIMRNYTRISPALLLRQTQFRTRLDMYCTLVVVFVALSISTVAALWKFSPWHLPAWVGLIAFLALAALSYKAAITSARGYGSVLRAIASEVSSAVARERQ